MATRQEFLSLYRDKFLPVYSDLVSFLGDKPQELLVQFENINSHLICVLEYGKSQKGQENLDKAYNHLTRATLDSSKLLWITINAKLDALLLDETSRTFGFSLSQKDLRNGYGLFKELGRIARTVEMQYVGDDPLMSLPYYRGAIDTGFGILKHEDKERVQKIRNLSFIALIKSQIIGFFLGIIASIIASILWKAFE
ncbi:MAG: hypothetical protein F9K24_00825 [Leptonema illini]|uniref:Uncharacterized protein n=2 Tax=Leptonema illini TaxID=183 RepID=H2CG37_9LEPT|nr:hypothetical protein [Leptonema illini]EHQ07885.1 hypothetical protein Lepil_3223 [Leptonema illini DSM 21528]KAB2935303.1 MAG: hypothetical protein F9K24_00825 [Leptonema illini]